MGLHLFYAVIALASAALYLIMGKLATLQRPTEHVQLVRSDLTRILHPSQ